MARTTETAVKDVLLSDYGPKSDGTDPSLVPFIQSASVMVDRAAAAAAAKGETLTSTELELIERWLSAHFYVMSDQTYANKQTGGAGGTFHGRTGMRLEASKYGQNAMLLDYSGTLESLSTQGRKKVQMIWLGKAPSAQTEYRDRD